MCRAGGRDTVKRLQARRGYSGPARCRRRQGSLRHIARGGSGRSGDRDFGAAGEGLGESSGGVHDLDVLEQVLGETVCYGADARDAAGVVREGLEVGVEELVCFGYWYGECEPVIEGAARRHVSDAVVGKPFCDSRDGFWRRSRKGFHL